MSDSDGTVYDALDLRPVRQWLLEDRADWEAVSDGVDEAVETHYDTPDWRFHRAGLSLRIRTPGSQPARQGTGESDESDGGSARRPRALTQPLDGSPLAPAEAEVARDAAAALSDCQGVVGERVGALSDGRPLEPRFELRSRQERFRLRRDGAAFAAVVLDEITVPLGDQDEPVRWGRVEVTAGRGDDPSLRDWLGALQASFGLQPAAPSRDTAALLALGLAAPALPDLGDTTLAADRTAAETAFAVLRGQFAKCLTHDPGTRLGEDIEALHDMRVATRRMRAALRLYEPFLPVRLLALTQEVAWLGRALGEVRDLDVQSAQLDAWRGELQEPDRPALDALAAIVLRQRAAARRKMLRALGSRRFERLVERMTAALVRGPATTSRSARTPVLAAAPDLIREQFRRVEKPGKKIRKGSPEERYHRLRIRCKALRYALEFHRGLYGAKAEALIKRLVALQDLLGDHQDAAVAAASLRDLVTRHGRRLPPETLFVVGILSERYARRAVELRTGFAAAFKRVRGPRWTRLERALDAARPAPPRARSPAAPAASPTRRPTSAKEDETK